MFVVSAALGTVFVWWRNSLEPSHQASHRSSAPGVAGLLPLHACQTGLRFVQDSAFVESLPYFRHALQQTSGRMWQAHFGLFCALAGASLQDERHLGYVHPITRSSYERMRMLREALSHLDSAEVFAKHPHDIAMFRRNRAQLMKTWGLGWNAFVNYSRAEEADPSWIETARLAGDLVDLMRHPTRVDPPGAELPGGPVEPHALERDGAP